MSQGRNSSGGNRRNRNHRHHGNQNKSCVAAKSKSDDEPSNENSPVVMQFKAYAAELDDKHDRYERIVKICRDLTIESKRIIFLLHTLDGSSEREAILNEAERRLDNLKKTPFKNIALELNGQDPYRYARAYSCGLQEFVEAWTFYRYSRDKNIEDWTCLEESLTYEATTQEDEKGEKEANALSSERIKTLVAPNEFILGIADLTGELMRKCIGNLASGDTESCYETCRFVRDMYRAFLGCSSVSSAQTHRKLYTLKQSLMKMENVCYAIKVRGSEIPKHMLADVADATNNDYHTVDDEGYQGY